jgi:hypothetical protein
MPTQQHDAPAAEQIRRVRADAACLCQVVAASDLPAGLVVVDLGHPPGDLQGAAIGSGHAFAEWAGDRLGRQGVGVAVGHLLELCQSQKCTECVQPMVEAVALHEVAHIIWGTDEIDAERIRRVMADLAPAATANTEPRKRAKDHDVKWAATLTVLAARAMQYRPGSADMLAVCIRTDLESHGYSHDALLQVIGQVHATASLRELLDPSGILHRSLLSAQLHYQRPLKQQATTQHGAVLAACTSPR